MLTIDDFLDEARPVIQRLLERKEETPEDFIFSDIEDEAGNQYVDLVQEGGGVLGIALVGYTYVLEALGIRFLSLAGTSAGSINTILMASLGKPAETKSEKILKVLIKTDFWSFVDGGDDARSLIESFRREDLLELGIDRLISVVRNKEEITKQFGINPGKAFQSWLDRLLTQQTTLELLDNMKAVPDLFVIDRKLRNGNKIRLENPDIHLAIISADITTHTKVCFPEMADLYYKDPMNTNPAEFVRASMAIPLFFKPHVVNLTRIDRRDPFYLKKWEKKAGFIGAIPEKVFLVDGGIMSNFPIDALYQPNQLANRPIFGVKLGVDRIKAQDNNKLKDFAQGCFNSARSLRDFEFLANNPIFKDLIAYINPGDHNWLNFQISDTDKIDLFKRGVDAAEQFLSTFKWRAYKQKQKNNFLSLTLETGWGLLHPDDVIRKLGLDDRVKKALEMLRQTGRSLHVLWIDDDYTNDAIELIVLNRLGLKVTPVSSSRAARELIRQQQTPFDLIITDANREGNSNEGILFCKELREQIPAYETVPVIVHSITQGGNTDTWPDFIRNKSSGRDVRILKDLVLETLETLSEVDLSEVMGNPTNNSRNLNTSSPPLWED